MKLVQLQKVRDPYNYCDRWCQRCLATKNCKVFKDEQKWRKKCIKEGKDPDSPEESFKEVANSMQQAIKLIYKGAKKWGIDPQSLEPKNEEEFQEYCSQQEQKSNFIHANPLFLLSQECEDGLLEFLANFDSQEIESVPDLQTIQWYATLVPAKIYRGLAEDESDVFPIDNYDDTANSFSIALRGVNASHVSLQKLDKSYPQFVYQLESLIAKESELKNSLELNLKERVSKCGLED